MKVLKIFGICGYFFLDVFHSLYPHTSNHSRETYQQCHIIILQWPKCYWLCVGNRNWIIIKSEQKITEFRNVILIRKEFYFLIILYLQSQTSVVPNTDIVHPWL